MQIEHRFSLFIFQLAEKMNDPNIHAFYRDAKKLPAEEMLIPYAKTHMPKIKC